MKKDNSKQIVDIISKMTLTEKIGQLCVPILQSSDIPPEIEKAIREIGIGMVRYCPNANFDNSSTPMNGPNRYLSPRETAELLNEVQEMTQKSRMQIPLLIAVDQEGSTRSDMNRGGVSVYPAHMAFGAIDDTELTYMAGFVTATEFRAMGINLVQAPIIDVITFEGRNTIKASSFGESVELVKKHGIALMQGYKDGGLSAMAKHFPGYGSIATDAHKGVAEITKSKEELENVDLAAFTSVFANEVDGIMMGHVITPSLDEEEVPATLSSKIIKGLIRKKMGFDGIIETDAMRMKAIQERYGTAQASVMAVKAGCDLVLLRGEFDHFMEGYDAILNAANMGELDETEINESVRRILTIKFNLNLFKNPFVDPKNAEKVIGCEEHKLISHQIAKRSVTVVRENSELITFRDSSTRKLLVISVEPQKIAAAMDLLQSKDMLIRAFQKLDANTLGLMVNLNPEESEINKACKLSESADVIVVGTCNAINHKQQAVLVNRLLSIGKPLIVVSMESPYDILEFKDVENYLCTYGVSNDSMIAVADIVYGKSLPLGKLPVRMPL